jgi:hypothetical protein
MPGKIFDTNPPLLAVEVEATHIFRLEQVLNELAKKGADEGPEAIFLRNKIESIIRNTEGKYGPVFKKP